MKNFNEIKFLVAATTTFNEWLKSIDDAETYDAAKGKGNAALGFIDCMITFLNSAISTENNDFTENLDEVIDDWTKSVYQHMINKADATNQPKEVMFKLFKLRDVE